MEEQLLTVREVAKTLGLSPSTVRNMLWDGRLRRIKIGGATRIRKQEIDDLILYGYQPQPRTTKKVSVKMEPEINVEKKGGDQK